jgi:hypothetical protein
MKQPIFDLRTTRCLSSLHLEKDRVDADSVDPTKTAVAEDAIEYEYEYRDAEYEYEETQDFLLWTDNPTFSTGVTPPKGS